MPSYGMEPCESSQQEVSGMNDPPHLEEAVVPVTSVDITSETHVQSSNGQEVVNQAVAAVVASVAHQVQSIFSSTVIRPPSLSGPPILLTSGIESKLKDLWSNQSRVIEVVSEDHWKNPEFPLARIKKIMRMDEDVKMISGEVPVLFSKAIEIFIMELTMRAWLHTEDNKRRTVQRSDIAMAIAKNDMFDFLIDIVPREEIQSKTNKPSAPGTSTKDEQGLGSGEVANLLQPDLLQAYVQLLAQQSEGSASTAGGEAETSYSSSSFSQALASNSSLIHQLVQIQNQQQNTERLLSQSSDSQFSIDESQSLLSHSSGSTTVNTLITSASNASQELQPQGRDQVLAHHSIQPSVLHHSAETSPQRITPLLSSHNQFTLSTSHQEQGTISEQNVASSEMQQVLIQEIGSSVESEDAELHRLSESAIHTTSLSSIPSLIPSQSFGSPQIQLDLQSPSMLEFTDDSVVVGNASLTEHVTDSMQHQVSSQ